MGLREDMANFTLLIGLGRSCITCEIGVWRVFVKRCTQDRPRFLVDSKVVLSRADVQSVLKVFAYVNVIYVSYNGDKGQPARSKIARLDSSVCLPF